MKKKKILIAIFCFSLAICLAGCGETNTAKAIATGIDKKTQKLEAVVASMEDINYNDIVISEISPLEDQTFNTVSTGNSLSKKKWYTIGGASQSATKTSTVVDGNKKFPNARYVSQKSGDKIGLTNYENNSVCQQQATGKIHHHIGQNMSTMFQTVFQGTKLMNT